MYAARGSRKAGKIAIGGQIEWPELKILRGKICQAARQWGLVFVHLFPDGSIILLRQWKSSPYWCGNYTRSLKSADLRDDLMFAMRQMGSTIAPGKGSPASTIAPVQEEERDDSVT